MTRSPYALTIASVRLQACQRLLAQWDARDPWDATFVRLLEQQLIELVYALTAPRIPDVRSGEAVAKMVREALKAE